MAQNLFAAPRGAAIVFTAALLAAGCSQSGRLSGRVTIDGKEPVVPKDFRVQLVFHEPGKEGLRFDVRPDGTFDGPNLGVSAKPGKYDALLMIYAGGPAPVTAKARAPVVLEADTRTLEIDFPQVKVPDAAPKPDPTPPQPSGG
jgi:hypothetical protein